MFGFIYKWLKKTVFTHRTLSSCRAPSRTAPTCDHTTQPHTEHTHTQRTHTQCTHNAHTQRTQRTHRKRKVRQCGVRYYWNSPFAQASRAEEGKESRTPHKARLVRKVVRQYDAGVAAERPPVANDRETIHPQPQPFLCERNGPVSQSNSLRLSRACLGN
jgi:hypothetical protein